MEKPKRLVSSFGLPFVKKYMVSATYLSSHVRVAGLRPSPAFKSGGYDVLGDQQPQKNDDRVQLERFRASRRASKPASEVGAGRGRETRRENWTKTDRGMEALGRIRPALLLHQHQHIQKRGPKRERGKEGELERERKRASKGKGKKDRGECRLQKTKVEAQKCEQSNHRNKRNAARRTGAVASPVSPPTLAAAPAQHEIDAPRRESPINKQGYFLNVLSQSNSDNCEQQRRHQLLGCTQLCNLLAAHCISVRKKRVNVPRRSNPSHPVAGSSRLSRKEEFNARTDRPTHPMFKKARLH
eukprot:4122529-Pleurochrysis_carterae.AAC.1